MFPEVSGPDRTREPIAILESVGSLRTGIGHRIGCKRTNGTRTAIGLARLVVAPNDRSWDAVERVTCSGVKQQTCDYLARRPRDPPGQSPGLLGAAGVGFGNRNDPRWGTDRAVRMQHPLIARDRVKHRTDRDAVAGRSGPGIHHFVPSSSLRDYRSTD